MPDTSDQATELIQIKLDNQTRPRLGDVGVVWKPKRGRGRGKIQTNSLSNVTVHEAKEWLATTQGVDLTEDDWAVAYLDENRKPKAQGVKTLHDQALDLLDA